MVNKPGFGWLMSEMQLRNKHLMLATDLLIANCAKLQSSWIMGSCVINDNPIILKFSYL